MKLQKVLHGPSWRTSLSSRPQAQRRAPDFVLAEGRLRHFFHVARIPEWLGLLVCSPRGHFRDVCISALSGHLSFLASFENGSGNGSRSEMEAYGNPVRSPGPERQASGLRLRLSFRLSASPCSPAPATSLRASCADAWRFLRSLTKANRSAWRSSLLNHPCEHCAKLQRDSAISTQIKTHEPGARSNFVSDSANSTALGMRGGITSNFAV